MDFNEFIKRIKYIRMRAGLSARALSFEIGKNETYIYKLESGFHDNPSYQVITDIIKACGSSVEEFFYHDIEQYQKDREMLELFKKVPKDKKDSIINILKY